MKKYMFILIVILGVTITYLIHQNRVLNRQYKASVENIKAYDSQLNDLDNDNRVFKLTIEQLNYFSDSVLTKMKEVQKQLGIKDKRLQQLQYQLSQGTKTDTLVLTDTIFSNPQFKLDTIIGDEWFKTKLLLQYPSTIAITPEIKLERFTFISGKRETVKPPKRFFLSRWLQKRHTVVEVKVKENNPYVKNKEQKFVQIID